MIVKGERIQFRAIDLKDANVLQALINDPVIETSVAGWSFPVSEIEQIEWIRNLGSQKNTMRAMIETIDTLTQVGTLILSSIDYKNAHAEIHIKLVREYHGLGYGKEAIKLACDYAFDQLRLNCIYAIVNEDNIASQNLFLSSGFEKEGILRSRIYKNGKYINTVSFSLVKQHD